MAIVFENFSEHTEQDTRSVQIKDGARKMLTLLSTSGSDKN